MLSQGEFVASIQDESFSQQQQHMSGSRARVSFPSPGTAVSSRAGGSRAAARAASTLVFVLACIAVAVWHPWLQRVGIEITVHVQARAVAAARAQVGANTTSADNLGWSGLTDAMQPLPPDPGMLSLMQTVGFEPQVVLPLVLAFVYLAGAEQLGATLLVLNAVAQYLKAITDLAFAQGRPSWLTGRVAMWHCPIIYGCPSGHALLLAVFYVPLARAACARIPGLLAAATAGRGGSGGGASAGAGTGASGPVTAGIDGLARHQQHAPCRVLVARAVVWSVAGMLYLWSLYSRLWTGAHFVHSLVVGAALAAMLLTWLRGDTIRGGLAWLVRRRSGTALLVVVLAATLVAACAVEGARWLRLRYGGLRPGHGESSGGAHAVALVDQCNNPPIWQWRVTHNCLSRTTTMLNTCSLGVGYRAVGTTLGVCGGLVLRSWRVPKPSATQHVLQTIVGVGGAWVLAYPALSAIVATVSRRASASTAGGESSGADRAAALVQLVVWATTLFWVTFGAPMVCSTLCNMRSPEREGSPHLRGRARTPSDGMLSLRLGPGATSNLGSSNGSALGAMHDEREPLLPAPSLLTAVPAANGAVAVKAARMSYMYGTGPGAIV